MSRPKFSNVMQNSATSPLQPPHRLARAMGLCVWMGPRPDRGRPAGKGFSTFIGDWRRVPRAHVHRPGSMGRSFSTRIEGLFPSAFGAGLNWRFSVVVAIPHPASTSERATDGGLKAFLHAGQAGQAGGACHRWPAAAAAPRASDLAVSVVPRGAARVVHGSGVDWG